MDDLSEMEGRTLTITKTLDAPITLVWEAWAQSHHIASWWAPLGMKLIVKKHDFREGGNWDYVMATPSGETYRSYGTYDRIERPELIETSANFLPMTENVSVITTLIELGKKTEMIFQVVHPTIEYAREQEKKGFYRGWGALFDGLNQYLNELPS